MACAVANEQSDAELLQRMLRRDGRAWRAFRQRYDGLVYASIDRVLRRFPDLGRQTEREECHAVFLSSLVGRDMHKLRVFELARGNRLSTWIAMLATNAAWDHLRSLARTPQLATWVELEAQATEAASPLSALLAKEDVSQVARVLRKLSKKDRQFVRLFYLGTEDAEQVAAAMRISVKTVYTKKHKLKARLLKELRARGDGEPAERARRACA